VTAGLAQAPTINIVEIGEIEKRKRRKWENTELKVQQGEVGGEWKNEYCVL
jgi:hypothetical protein